MNARPPQLNRTARAILCIAMPCLLAPAALAQDTKPYKKIVYPQAHRGNTMDIYHGSAVADPYRWLEDTNSDETAAWVEAENKITFEFLESIPARDIINHRLTELWDYERFGVPFKEGGKYFFTKNDGLQPQSILYVTNSLDQEPRILIDPNTLSTDGTIALSGYSVSKNGRYIAYAIADGGSDWRTWKVREIETGEDLADEIRWSKFSGAAWNTDSTAFYYTQYPQPNEGDELSASNENSKVFKHTIGTPQSDDVLTYERPDHPRWGLYSATSEDGRFLIIYISEGTDPRNGLAWSDLSAKSPEVTVLTQPMEASYAALGNQGTKVFLTTDLDAPLSRVIAVDIDHPARDTWTEVIPESKSKLESASIIGDKLVVEYLIDAKSDVKLYSLAGEATGSVILPGIGSLGGLSGKIGDPEAFFSFASYNRPSTIYKLNIATGATSVYRQPKINFNPDDYTTRQVFYYSLDGTQVPMFITHRKGIDLNNNNPTLLYGYGGFNISMTPYYSPAIMGWLDMGGVYAVANLRGGGEYGKEWHDAGKLLNKQNVFDDFIAAAEYLIEYRYTRPDKLAIFGGSNGGLLVGACMTQRPELFGAAIPVVGVMDMLRFDKFTIGHAWRSDYGWPDKNIEDFKNNLSYSPLHNVEQGVCYPPTLVMTADHDDRVVPGHSFKYTAALQYAQSCDSPVLIRVDTRSGHGAGKPTAKRIEEAADRWAFLHRVLNMEPLPEVEVSN